MKVRAAAAGPAPNGLGSGYALGSGGAGAGLDPASRPSKPKRMNPNRTSLNEMKRRVAAITDFVVRVQDDTRKGEGTASAGSGPGGGAKSVNGASAEPTAANGDAGPDALPDDPDGAGMHAAPVKVETASVNGAADNAGDDASLTSERLHSVDFAALSAADMMANLKARLILWEDEYGRYTRA